MNQFHRAQFPETAIGILVMAGIVWEHNGQAVAEDVLGNLELKIPLWSYSAEASGAFGYKDNLLLSHTDGEGGAFWMSSAEVMIFRLPSQGWQFSFFADANDVRYFNSASVDDEQTALAMVQISKDFGSGWKSALGLNYVYQNQVFDFSTTYTDEASVGKILGHSLMPRWSLRKTIGSLWIEGEGSGTRQWLDSPLDSYWQAGPRTSVGWKWECGSELVLAYQYAPLIYDNREQVDELGTAVPHTSLALEVHMAELSFVQFWDQQRRWGTVTALGYNASFDNGSGFFDYGEYRLSQQLKYRRDEWEVSARARLAQFDYSNQTVSTTDKDLRSKTWLNLSLRLERNLTKHLKAHAAYSWDRSISNVDFDDYQANVVMGGLALVF